MNFKNLLKTLGPGLLWAGAAIGVSHLVQSTRAGATYGFELVWIILLINLFKYPFFEFGPRYAASTGENLLQGYNRMGKWVVILYVFLTFMTMFTLMAAISAVTAGIFSSIFKNIFDNFQWALIILISGTIIVLIGKYSLIDNIIKFIIVLLAISTVVAVVSAFSGAYDPSVKLSKSFEWEFSDIALLIAIAGWMPSAIDISVWHSVLTIAKKEATGYSPKLKESLLDFNIGYIGTVVLSLGFLSLGAIIMYGNGLEFSSNGTKFSEQLINLFTSSLGQWAYPLIAIAAITTMSSTTLTCLDAYPRVLKPSTEIIFPKLNFKNKKKGKYISIFWIAVLLIGTIIILKFFMSSMQFLVDLATSLSFLTAPLLGFMNYKAVTGKNVSKKNQPPTWLKVLSWIGLVVLSLFSLYFIVWKFFIN